jgi:hypothetical protein
MILLGAGRTDGAVTEKLVDGIRTFGGILGPGVV